MQSLFQAFPKVLILIVTLMEFRFIESKGWSVRSRSQPALYMVLYSQEIRQGSFPGILPHYNRVIQPMPLTEAPFFIAAKKVDRNEPLINARFTGERRRNPPTKVRINL